MGVTTREVLLIVFLVVGAVFRTLGGRHWDGRETRQEERGGQHAISRKLMGSTSEAKRGTLKRLEILHNTRNTTGPKTDDSYHHFKSQNPPLLHGAPACMSNKTQPSFNGTFSKVVHALHDAKHPLHGIRPVYTWTWKDVQSTISKTGHSWCSLVRDNWSCTGEEYEKVLNSTKPFQQEFGLQNLKPNLFIFADGNSHLAQLIVSWFCWSSVEMEIWVGPKNDFFAHVAAVNLSFLLIDNDPRFQKTIDSYKELIRLMKQQCSPPDVIILGTVNNLPAKISRGRMKMYKKEFPSAISVQFFGKRTPDSCGADGKNCSPKARQHVCLPGPGL
eukprot:409520-Rhodomonas_salina.2